MPIVQWKRKYEVGNLEIDSEHKVFVKIIQKIHQAMTHHDANTKVERLVRELFKYADFHFCSEENIMLDVQYPGFAEHKRRHEELLAQLKTKVFMYDLDLRDLESLIDFLVEWFVNHTVNVDKKLAKYLECTTKSTIKHL